MAVDTFLVIFPYGSSTPLTSSSATVSTGYTLLGGYSLPAGVQALIPVNDWSFEIEQTLNIGSQSSGAGAGKVTFDPFSFVKTIDTLSPKLLQSAAAGVAYQELFLIVSQAGSKTIFLQYVFKLAAVSTITWASSSEVPTETITVEYGDLQMFYAPEEPNGTLGTPVAGGWNRVTNMADTGTGSVT